MYRGTVKPKQQKPLSLFFTNVIYKNLKVVISHIDHLFYAETSVIFTDTSGTA